MSLTLCHRLFPLGGFLLLGMLWAGCLGTADETTEVTIAEALAFEPMGRGRQAEIDTTEIIIRDLATWTAYQDSLRPLMPFKDVNFEQEMVLLAALPVPSGGYDLRFDIVEQTEDGLTARYRLFTPDTDCRVTMGAGVAFQVIRLAQKEGPLHFERELETLNCTDTRSF